MTWVLKSSRQIGSRRGRGRWRQMPSATMSSQHFRLYRLDKPVREQLSRSTTAPGSGLGFGALFVLIEEDGPRWTLARLGIDWACMLIEAAPVCLRWLEVEYDICHILLAPTIEA